MLRVMLIDDESLARQRLRQLLESESDTRIVAEAESAKEARALVKSGRPNVLFLDVRMPNEDGFKFLSSLPNRPVVVFVTAYSEYAWQAFDFEAIDYLLKPVRPARLKQAIKRVRGALGELIEQIPYGLADRICLRTPERTIVARLADVSVLKADRDFTEVSVADQQPLFICQPLGVYERTLPNPPFVRLDRSLIVNLTTIQSVEISPSRGAKVFINGLAEPLPLGRAALRRLRSAIPNVLSTLPEF